MSTAEAVARLVADPDRAKAVARSIRLAGQIQELQKQRVALLAEQDRLRAALPDWGHTLELIDTQPVDLRRNIVRWPEAKKATDLDRYEESLDIIDSQIEDLEGKLIESPSASIQDVQAVLSVAVERMRELIVVDSSDVSYDHSEVRLFRILERAHSDLITLLKGIEAQVSDAAAAPHAEATIPGAVRCNDEDSNIGQLLHAAQRAPVTVTTKNGRPAAVVMSVEDYERMRGAAWKRLFETMETARKAAAERGLTDELLDQLLADES